MKNKKFWNWVKNDAGESDVTYTPTTRTLYLNGVIAEESWYGDEVTPQLFKDELESDNGDIEVWINSVGGDVYAATQIYNILKTYNGKVTVKIDSLAASAASVIAMAGDEVLMSPLSLLMVHNPITIAAGNTDDMQKAIDMLDEVKESIINAYEIKSGLSRAKISHMMDCETWLSAKKTFTQKTIGAHKLTALIKISEELLNDSAFDLESYIASEFARKISDAEEEAFITGNGSGKPFGILHDKEGADVGITAVAANAITTNELIDLYYSLRSPYRKRAVWIMNDATVNMIRKLKDGNGQYIWEPGIKSNDTDTILGRKVYTTTCMPTAKTGAKTVAFGDLDFYWIGDREGISFKRLNELYATKGQVGFLATKRLDARLILPETIKVLKMK